MGQVSFISIHFQTKSEVQLNIDFVTADSPDGPKAIITAIDPDKGKTEKVEKVKEEEKAKKPKPELRRGFSRESSKDRKGSDGEKSSTRSSSISDEDRSKAVKKADAGNGNGNGEGRKAVGGKKAAASVPKAGKPSTNQTAKNGKSEKSGSNTETESDDDKKSDSSQNQNQNRQNVVQDQNAILEGEDWKVVISSRHELATTSDEPNRTVIITPKQKVLEVETEVEEEVKVVEKAKVREKKITFDRKVADPRADPIPKPPQYPCARPPRGYVPPKPVPNASPGMSMTMSGRNSVVSSNVAVVSPLPTKTISSTSSTPARSSFAGDKCGTFQMYIKQEPIDLDVQAVPPALVRLPLPMRICNVSYDSIYDDPDYF